MKTKHISECSCGTHLVQTQFDEEFKQFYIAIYQYGQPTIRRMLWNRIKYAFGHLFTGRIFDDQIILDIDEADKLANFLKDRTNDAD